MAVRADSEPRLVHEPDREGTRPVPLVRRPREMARRRRAELRAAPSRSRAGARTSRGRARRGSSRGTGTASARRRRSRRLDPRSGSARSRRPPTRAGSTSERMRSSSSSSRISAPDASTYRKRFRPSRLHPRAATSRRYPPRQRRKRVSRAFVARVLVEHGARRRRLELEVERGLSEAVGLVPTTSSRGRACRGAVAPAVAHERRGRGARRGSGRRRSGRADAPADASDVDVKPDPPRAGRQ